MNISRRTALILSLTSLLGLGGTAAVSGLVLDDAFGDLEARDARRDTDRVRAAVDADLAGLSWAAGELAGLEAALAGNVTEAEAVAHTLRAADVDAVALRTDGNWSAWSVHQDGLSVGLPDAVQPPPPGLVASVAGSSLAGAGPLDPRSTLVRVDGDAYLAGARAPRDGPLVVALRLVDDAYVEHLAAATGLRVEAHAGGFDQDWSLHRDGLSAWVASDTLRGDDQPVLNVQVTGERDVYRQGLVAFLLVVAAAAVLSGLLLGTGLLVLRSTVTARLCTLAERVGHVRTAGDLSARVAMEGDDELAALSHEFDLMLADLEHRSTELTRSNEELGAFAGVVSHDLKSPLSTFTMNLALMARRAERDGDVKQREQVARMERTVATMQDRIEAVLEYSRAGREPKMKVVALDDVARSVMEDVEAHLVEAGAHVELQPLPSVRGDRHALGQVFQNLIQNAVKYRRPDVPPRIRVRAEEQDGGWAVLVADNGRGFEQEDAERMLQPFQRLENGNDQAGHGVGLATVVRIMESHGGTLTAFGRPGRGAIMRLWFPKDRVLAAPSPGRASLVGGLKHALPTRAPVRPVASAPPLESHDEGPAPEPELRAASEPGAPPAEPGPEPEPAPTAPPAPTAEPEPAPEPGPTAARRRSHHTLRGASLTDEERAELEAHLRRAPGSQRSSRPRRAERHGPQDGPEARPADRAR